MPPEPQSQPRAARRPRPSRRPHVGALAIYVLARLGVALLVALPVARAVGASLGSYPEQDAALWEPGAEMLLEVGRRLEPLAARLGLAGGSAGVVGLLLLLAPLAALVASLGPVLPALSLPRPSARTLGAVAVRAFAPLVLLLGVTLLLQTATLALFWLVGRLLARSLELGATDQYLTAYGVLLVGAAIAWIFGVLQDVARVAMVQHGEGLLGGVGAAVALARAGLGRLLGAAGWRALLAGAVLLGIGGLGLARGGGAAGTAVAVAGLHVAAIFVAVLIRVSWLRWVTERLVTEIGMVPVSARAGLGELGG